MNETCGVFIFQWRWFFRFYEWMTSRATLARRRHRVQSSHDTTTDYYCRGFAARYYCVRSGAAGDEGILLSSTHGRSALTSFWRTRREPGGTGSGGEEAVAPQRRGPESGRNVVSRLNRPRVSPSHTDGLCRSCFHFKRLSAPRLQARPVVEIAVG